MNRIHLVKCWPDFFDALRSGEKPFDLRKNDRGYQKGDTFVPMEFVPHGLGAETKGTSTGRFDAYEITYVLSGWGLQPEHVCLGLRPEIRANQLVKLAQQGLQLPSD